MTIPEESSTPVGPPRRWPGVWEIAAGAAALLLWLALYAGGVSVGTTPFFDNIMDSNRADFETRRHDLTKEEKALYLAQYGSPPDDSKWISFDKEAKEFYEVDRKKPRHAFFSCIMILLFYTVTNICLLSMLAGTLGVLGRRLAGESGDDLSGGVARFYCTSILGSLLVYLIIFSGAYALFGFEFHPPPAGQVSQVNDSRLSYAKLAALSSAICLVEGYRPFIFRVVINRVRAVFTSTRDLNAGS